MVTVRARITVKTLDSLIFGKKNAEKLVQFQIVGNRPKNSSVPGIKRGWGARTGVQRGRAAAQEAKHRPSGGLESYSLSV